MKENSTTDAFIKFALEAMDPEVKNAFEQVTLRHNRAQLKFEDLSNMDPSEKLSLFTEMKEIQKEFEELHKSALSFECPFPTDPQATICSATIDDGTAMGYPTSDMSFVYIVCDNGFSGPALVIPRDFMPYDTTDLIGKTVEQAVKDHLNKIGPVT